MKRCYKNKRMAPAKLLIISQANEIIRIYTAQGYKLTLRQIYYRFIAEDLFPDSWIDVEYNLKHHLDPNTKNTQKNYKHLGVILGHARMAGLIDWTAIEDRTRELAGRSHWETAASIVKTCVNAYNIDRWLDQKYRVEIWIEKDALEGIVTQAAHIWDCPAFSCRGYGSLSSLWEASRRFTQYIKDGKRPVILHLGDHDPSGIDMTRDINDRLNHFIEMDWLHDNMSVIKAKVLEIHESIEIHLGDGKDNPEAPLTVRRIAMTREQIDEYNPPPNPAKSTDSRYKEYEKIHRPDSWELDALEPSVLDALIQSTIQEYVDVDKYEERVTKEETNRRRLDKAATYWDGLLAGYIDKLKIDKKKR